MAVDLFVVDKIPFFFFLKTSESHLGSKGIKTVDRDPFSIC